LMKKMLQKIAARGESPSTWRLAQNLTPENWGKMMTAFQQLSPREQEVFAFRFGSGRFTGERRIQDGFEKLAAVTLQKGLRATALKKTESAREIGEILDKVSKLPLPKYVTESFSAYAKVLDTASVSIAKMLTSPDRPTALVNKINEATSMDSELALKMTRNLQEVYKKSKPQEQIFTVDDIPDHPKPK
jgi:S-adenosylmethionine:tRNA-ribosyltransferase-isomerase (queuine synthetase)